jgi:cytochrome c oxidase subunit II
VASRLPTIGSGVRFGVISATASLAGCAGELSTLDPAGPAAETIAWLWWIMLAGAGVILVLVLALLGLTFLRRRPLARIPGRSWLIWGGLVLPGVTLTALLGSALVAGERLLPHPAPDVVEVRAVARMWAWEFGPPGGDLEPGRLVIPAGRPVDVHITSVDVIHSFWVPRLAGKMDAIPGYTNVLRIVAPVPGVYHGVCAEYCGIGHDAMPFVVEAVPETEFAEAGP